MYTYVYISLRCIDFTIFFLYCYIITNWRKLHIEINEHMFYNLLKDIFGQLDNFVWHRGARGYMKEKTEQYSTEEYREKLIQIFRKMNDTNKLKFWYRYISAIENGED